MSPETYEVFITSNRTTVQVLDLLYDALTAVKNEKPHVVADRIERSIERLEKLHVKLSSF